MRLFLETLILAAICASPARPAHSAAPLIKFEQIEGGRAARIVGAQIGLWIQSNDLAKAKEAIDIAVVSKERLKDGKWVLGELFNGYGEWLVTQTSWDEPLAKIREWRIAEPTNADAALIEATYWVTYAWFARGGEFASNVPARAWEIAGDRMAKARAVLEECKSYASDNPVWYSQMLSVALFQSWPRSAQMALFNEAVKAEPYYYATYFIIATSLLPRWGGSLADYHQFVKAAVNKTKPIDCETMYARLYWALSQGEWDKDPFKDLRIPWKSMKAGFDDLMKRYPDSQWNLHHYAFFACRANDGKTFNKLQPNLDVQKIHRMPPIWNQAYTLDYCIERFVGHN